MYDSRDFRYSPSKALDQFGTKGQVAIVSDDIDHNLAGTFCITNHQEPEISCMVVHVIHRQVIVPNKVAHPFDNAVGCF